MGRGARRARRDQAAVLPARDRLVLAPAVGGRARGSRRAPDRLHAREVAPCLGWAGVRDQLRALASRQREGGWQALAVITWTPDWAAAPPGGCERPGTRRAPPAARRGARRLPAADRSTCSRRPSEEGADLRFWSPWNEPNHPGVRQPAARRLRRRARRASAPGRYAELTRSLIQALDEAPGRAAARARRDRRAAEADALREQRARVHRRPAAGRRVRLDGLDPARLHRRRRPGRRAASALAARGCPQPHTIWITETGVGAAPRTSRPPTRSPTSRQAAASSRAPRAAGATTRV